MDVKIEPSWKEALKEEFSKPYFHELVQFVKEEYRKHTVYPPGRQIFRAFEACPFDQTKVVIIGQDPYHGPGQAHGLAFSVNDGVPIPPSLRNIFAEVHEDVGTPPPASGNLERWAQQGVLLLNAILTVRAREAGSHRGKGWEQFTDAVIKALSEQKEHLVFLLWGRYAQEKGRVIDKTKHLVLEAPHPSPLARGFRGCRHFSKANAYLRAHGQTPIVW
ncbi:MULTISPECIES: uracil-DNA glycosylase [Thermonema]|uniref:uracil-DNA glycosylase n=1 Tax=Thermonema TaxID=28194 RepID=UPI000571A9D1|nr:MULTISPECIES: uracil-DNA glycosylase [Thermonema]